LVQRGNNRSACFYGDGDYLRYLHYLLELSRRFRCAVHAYVLMTNHVHLLLTPECEDGPSQLMKHLGQRYVQYVNRTYRRSGTLWEGRFRSSVVQTNDYLLRCYRYIEMNPVRAGIVRHPWQYRWSSFAANGDGVPSRIVEPHDEYLALGRRHADRIRAYRSLFEQDVKPDDVEEIRLAVNGGYALGGQGFQQEIAAMLGRRVTPGVAGRPKHSMSSPGSPPSGT